MVDCQMGTALKLLMLLRVIVEELKRQTEKSGQKSGWTDDGWMKEQI